MENCLSFGPLLPWRGKGSLLFPPPTGQASSDKKPQLFLPKELSVPDWPPLRSAEKTCGFCLEPPSLPNQSLPKPRQVFSPLGSWREARCWLSPARAFLLRLLLLAPRLSVWLEQRPHLVHSVSLHISLPLANTGSGSLGKLISGLGN